MSNILFTVHGAEDNRGGICIRLSGSISSRDVSDLLLQLTLFFDDADSILLDFSDVTDIDAAALKLFCSCHRNLLFSGKQLRITGHDQGAVRRVIPPDGKRRHGSGCGVDWHHSCIWQVGE